MKTSVRQIPSHGVISLLFRNEDWEHLNIDNRVVLIIGQFVWICGLWYEGDKDLSTKVWY